MLVGYSKTQSELATSARQLLAHDTARSDNTDWTARWTEFGRLGWFDVLTSDNGHLDLEHLSVLLFEAGRAALISPYFQSVLSRGVFANGIANSLPERTAVLATADLTGPYLRQIDSDSEDAITISGGPFLVEWGRQAEAFIAPVTLSNGGTRIAVVHPDDDGVSVLDAQAMDDEPLAWVACDAVQVDPDRLLGADEPGSGIGTAAALGRLLRSVEMVGGTDAVLAMTVDYVTQREQFGRPLAVLQAVQHLCADMKIKRDAGLLAVSDALTCARNNGDDLLERTAVATWVAGRSYEQVTQSAAQLHGAMGYMLEYPLNRYFRRAKAQRVRLGRITDQLERIAELKFGHPAATAERARLAHAPVAADTRS